MRRCVVVGGADINNYADIKAELKTDDFFVFCDSGLKHRESLGVEAHLVVGDFDSYAKPDTNAEVMVLPCEKDDTDTVFAVKEAIGRGFKNFLLIGAVGRRLDHTLGNVGILNMLYTKGLTGKIIDDYSVMEIAGNKPLYIDDSYPYFSLLNITGEAEGVCIKNAKYPLDNARITTDYQYGISNEVIKGKVAEVSVKSGRLLLVKVKKD